MSLDDRAPVTRLPPVHEAWLPREHSLHRPRHGKRQLTALVSAVAFLATPAFMWVVGMRPAELENHEVAAFPSITEGWGFLTDMQPWATDNLVFRGQAITAADWVSRTFFGEPAPFDQGGSAPSGPLPAGPEERKPKATEPGNDPDAAGFRRVIEGANGWLYLGQDISAKCQPARPVSETVNRLAQLRQIVESSGREFMLVAVPDKTTMVPEHLPDTYAGKDCAGEATPALWNQLTNIAGAVDMRPPLQAAADKLGRPTYFQLDTHWTGEGALEMIRQVAERLEPGVSKTWRITKRSEVTGEADLPPLIGRSGQNKALAYRFMPDGKTNRAVGPAGDLIKPLHRKSRSLAGMVDRPTLLLGDSFTLPVSAYLPAAFSDVTQLYYSTVEPDPGLVVRTMADNEVVVVEIVERNIARGALPLIDDSFLTLLREELQKRPIR